MKELTKKERLMRQVKGQEIDRVPTLGGWIGGVRNLADLAGITVENYLADPMRGVIKANLALDVDGMIQPNMPTRLDQIRSQAILERDHIGIEPEALLERANSLPDNEADILADFNAAAQESYYRDYFETAIQTWEGIQPIPNFWDLGGHFPLYVEFGYAAFFMACALYPEAVGKIYWAKSLPSRESAKILARLYREYDLAPVMFCGEDLCNNKGPMVAPAFLRQYYYPSVRMILEPLLERGVRFIHHCDGDVRPLIDDFINLGFSGFQGFQYELGIDPYELKKRRSLLGEELLFFAGLSVTRTLPFGAPADIREEIDYFLDFSDGGKGLFLITSNVTGVEVPPDNLRLAYEYIHQWDASTGRQPSRRVWPWKRDHPE
jgi:hypothetical protein